MNLATTISIYAGGPGSGCNPAVGKCGRTATAVNEDKDSISHDGWVTKDGTFIRRHGTHAETAVAAGLVSQEQFAVRDALSTGNIRILYSSPSSWAGASAGIEVQALDEGTRNRIASAVQRMGFPETVLMDIRKPVQSIELSGRQIYTWMKTGIQPKRSSVAEFHTHTLDATAHDGTKLLGFTNAQQEQIHAVLSQIPSYLTTNFKAIVADPTLGAKHGRYDEDTHMIHINPHNFANEVRFGHGSERKIPHADLTLAHEIGHSVFVYMSRSEQEAWKRLSGWKEGDSDGQEPAYKETRPGWPKETETETHRAGARFTRHYAERNHDEDFADSFGFYVMGQKDRLPAEKRAFMAAIVEKFKRAKP